MFVICHSGFHLLLVSIILCRNKSVINSVYVQQTDQILQWFWFSGAVSRCVLVVTVVLSISCPKDPLGSFVTVDIGGTIEAPPTVCPLPVFPLMMS